MRKVSHKITSLNKFHLNTIARKSRVIILCCLILLLYGCSGQKPESMDNSNTGGAANNAVTASAEESGEVKNSTSTEKSGEVKNTVSAEESAEEENTASAGEAVNDEDTAVGEVAAIQGDDGSQVELMIASDIHYFAPELIERGGKFERMLEIGDGKQVNYIDEITDAFLSEVIEAKPDALILSGDITFNGEKKSHEDIADKLKKVEAAGVPVLVIPGNHDINNYYARKYNKDSLEVTDHINDKEFASIYKDFGYDEAVSRDDNSLSYITAISDKLWIFMMDSCKYVDNSETKPSQAGGSFSVKTYSWLEDRLKEAEKAGITPIIVMHHNSLIHNPRFTTDFTVDNSPRLINLLNQYHVKLTLSGHLHIQDIASKKSEENTIYDIASSALSVYTNQYGVLEVNPGESIEYHTQPVDVEVWAKENGSTDPNLLNFENYSYEFFSSNGYRKAYDNLTEAGLSEEDMKLMAQTIGEMNTYYFSGTVSQNKDTILNSEGYKLWVKTGDNSMMSYLNTMLKEPVEDENHITISLK